MLNDVEWASKSLILIRCNCSWLATGSGFGVWCHQWYGMVVTVRTPHGTPTALNCSRPGWNTIVKFCGFFGGTERGSPWITGVGPMWLCNLLTSGATVTRLWLDLSLSTFYLFCPTSRITYIIDCRQHPGSLWQQLLWGSMRTSRKRSMRILRTDLQGASRMAVGYWWILYPNPLACTGEIRRKPQNNM